MRLCTALPQMLVCFSPQLNSQKTFCSKITNQGYQNLTNIKNRHISVIS